MARRSVAILLLLAWFGLLGWSIYRLQDKEIEKLIWQRPYRDVLNLPQPEHAKVLALGYDQFVGAILFLRVIQAFGAKLHHIAENPRDLKAIENTFYVIAELDPHFPDLYKFGNFVLGDEGRDQEAALRFLDYGIEVNGNRTYRMAYEAIFICLMLEDYDRARTYIHLAKTAPDCPSYVPRMESYIDDKMGNYEIALRRRLRDHMEAYKKRDHDLLTVTRAKIESTVNNWHLSIIEAALDRYFEVNEDYPARLGQLEQDDYITTDSVRMVDGSSLRNWLRLVEAYDPDRLSIEKALARIMSTVAEEGAIVEGKQVPRDYRGEEFLIIDDTIPPIQKRPEIKVRSEVRLRTENALQAIRRRIEEFHRSEGRFPVDLTELPGMHGPNPELQSQDPAGMPWNYDPLLGVISSYVFPKL